MTHQLPLTHEEKIQKVGELIKGIKFAMLTTINSEGHLHTRPMMTLENEFDGILWFFAGKSSPLAEDLRTHTEVNLAYTQTHGLTYVSVAGKATLVDDKVRARKLWKPTCKTWFTEGVDDPNLMLVKVEAHSAQYWDSPSSVGHFLELAKSLLTGSTYVGESHEKVTLQH